MGGGCGAQSSGFSSKKNRVFQIQTQQSGGRERCVCSSGSTRLFEGPFLPEQGLCVACVVVCGACGEARKQEKHLHQCFMPQLVSTTRTASVHTRHCCVWCGFSIAASALLAAAISGACLFVCTVIEELRQDDAVCGASSCARAEELHAQRAYPAGCCVCLLACEHKCEVGG